MLSFENTLYVIAPDTGKILRLTCPENSLNNCRWTTLIPKVSLKQPTEAKFVPDEMTECMITTTPPPTTTPVPTQSTTERYIDENVRVTEAQATLQEVDPESNHLNICGHRHENYAPQYHIVGGRHADFAEWPWQVCKRSNLFLFKKRFSKISVLQF